MFITTLWSGFLVYFCILLQLKRHVVTIDSYADVPPKKEKKLQQAVATQPISVGICGSDSSFQLYSGVGARSPRHVFLVLIIFD